jgi:hypothetical protein
MIDLTNVAVFETGMRDGLGDRLVGFDRVSGDTLDVLRVRAELAAFGPALDDVVDRFSDISDRHLLPTRGLARQRGETRPLVFSDMVEGERLHDLLSLAHTCAEVPDLTIAVYIANRVFAALTALGRVAKVAHGILSLDRVIVTPRGRILLAEPMFGPLVERLEFSHARLWREMGVAMPEEPDPPLCDSRADVAQVAVMMLSLILGRPLLNDEHPDHLESLLKEVREVAWIRGGDKLASALGSWFDVALPMPARLIFDSAAQAQDALASLLPRARFSGSRSELQAFLKRLTEAAATDGGALATPDPVSDTAPPPPPLVDVVVPEAVSHDAVRPTETAATLHPSTEAAGDAGRSVGRDATLEESTAHQEAAAAMSGKAGSGEIPPDFAIDEDTDEADDGGEPLIELTEDVLADLDRFGIKLRAIPASRTKAEEKSQRPAADHAVTPTEGTHEPPRPDGDAVADAPTTSSAAYDDAVYGSSAVEPAMPTRSEKPLVFDEAEPALPPLPGEATLEPVADAAARLALEPEPEPEPIIEAAAPGPEPEPEQAIETAALEPEPTPEPVVEAAAPGPEPDPEQAIETAAPEPEPTPEPVVEAAPLEPEATPELVVEAAALESEPTPEPVIEAAPPGPKAKPEQVVEAVAPEAEPERESVVEMTAPESEPEPEPIIEATASGPEPEPEQVIETAAPDPKPTPEPAVQTAAFEPELEPEPVIEAAVPRLDPEPEQVVETVAPEPEPEPEPVVETAAPEPEPEAESIVEMAEPQPEPEPEPVVAAIARGLGLDRKPSLETVPPARERQPDPEPAAVAAPQGEAKPEPEAAAETIAPEPKPQPVAAAQAGPGNKKPKKRRKRRRTGVAVADGMPTTAPAEPPQPMPAPPTMSAGQPAGTVPAAEPTDSRMVEPTASVDTEAGQEWPAFTVPPPDPDAASSDGPMRLISDADLASLPAWFNKEVQEPPASVPAAAPANAPIVEPTASTDAEAGQEWPEFTVPPPAPDAAPSDGPLRLISDADLASLPARFSKEVQEQPVPGPPAAYPRVPAAPAADIAAEAEDEEPLKARVRSYIKESMTRTEEPSPEAHIFGELAPRRRPRWWRSVAVLAILTGTAIFTGMQWMGGRVRAGTVIIESAPAQAAVFIDGEQRGTTPLSLMLAPGEHSVELRQNDRQQTIALVVEPGTEITRHVEWGPVVATGSLTVTSEPPGARVTIDGTRAGQTPVTLSDLAVGRHTVVLESSAGSVASTVRIREGQTARLDVPIFSGWLAVFAPVELQVLEGGRLLGTTTESRIMVAPGTHRIELVSELFGYRAIETVEVKPGEVKALSYEPKGAVNFNAVPWAEVFVDGERVGETPLANILVTIGTREVVFRHPELGEHRRTVTVTQGDVLHVNTDLSQP